MYVPHCLYSLTVHGHLACFLVLAVVNNAAVNMRRAFPGGSAVKNPPALQELRVRSLGQEDTLEEGGATHSSVLGQRYLVGYSL